MPTLESGQSVGQYKVTQCIKANEYTETYRVEDESGHTYFLKLFILKRLPEKLKLAEDDMVSEISLFCNLQHKNILSFIGYGEIETEAAGKCQFYLTNYLSGELLVSRVQREGKLAEEEALRIYANILEGLQYVHTQGLLHNDITPRNIMMPAVGEGIVEIIDWGHISHRCSGLTTFDTTDLDVLYCANETFMGFYDERSDIFSATAVLYYMLTGKAPWEHTFAEGIKQSRKAILHKDYRKQTPLDMEAIHASDKTLALLTLGLAASPANRAKHAAELLAILHGAAVPEAKTPHPGSDKKPGGAPTPSDSQDQEGVIANPNQTDFEFKKGNGNGFADIAGMQSLKDYLNQRVVFVIKNPERAAKYRLTPPNGMLLYGPPGCGKSYVAEKFAEETGFNYVLINSSDLGSSFVHGSQDKIAQLFKQAAQHAPVVVCFDEFDALVPDRSAQDSQHYASEVNEFLSQLNNCSKKGIFVVGTTNRPDKIDPAVLRTGRIDKQVYVPMPDSEARTQMFKLHLAGRPLADDIDYAKLGELTANYIASDIAFIVGEASNIAAFTDVPITQALLEDNIRSIHSSLRPDIISFYDKLHEMMEGAAQTGKPAGYQIRDYGFSFN